MIAMTGINKPGILLYLHLERHTVQTSTSLVAFDVAFYILCGSMNEGTFTYQ